MISRHPTLILVNFSCFEETWDGAGNSNESNAEVDATVSSGLPLGGRGGGISLNSEATDQTWKPFSSAISSADQSGRLINTSCVTLPCMYL